MPNPRNLPSGKTPREYYGSELRRLREAACPRMSQEKLGQLTFVSGGYIGQLEQAVRVPQLDLSIRIDKALATGGVLERLHELLEFSRFPDFFKHAAEHEAQALTISEFGALIVPGLLQTPEYARALFLSGQPLLTDAELNEFVATRMERSSRLVVDPGGPELWYILDEAVIRRVIGSRLIMAEQLRHIAGLITRRRTIVQVATFEAGGHALIDGFLSLMTFADAPPLAYLEGPHAGQLVDEMRVVERCRRSYDLVRAAALSPEASLALILSAAEEHESAQALSNARKLAKE
ncbi:helix-turn-helix transcriptional regulator [Kitasatospora sp. CM 4170]|uniref:Helix-turn-helix transcriptional regulator n=1 Tax=Kitasatospora aburaviensis TaxID=67265 RepID=A0ABW1EZG5_9ACTN|nr:helix-turn-helix transcriptional regulator [Kitasatospora sp. CM 4170]WNM47101.1 helix-turn-helix transcriptional regulator [Kitasatospora sp. CM 4170]